MSTETEEVQEIEVAQGEVATPEPTAESSQVTAPQVSEDEALLAGFNAANGVEAPEPEPKPEPEKPTLIAGYTEDQVRKAFDTIAALEQRESKVFGSLGGLKQAVESLKQQPQTSSTKLTLDSLKRVSAEYPELAKLLVEDLGSFPVASTVDPSQVEQLVEQRVQTSVAKTTQAYEQRFLTFQHPDWRQVVASDDFVGWKETLPPETKAELDASWDAEFIGSRISEFKEWKSKNIQTKQTNQRRLEAAITPKGAAVTRAVTNETDAFLAGFKAVRGTI